MQYEPIKKSLGRFISGSLLMRKALYAFLDLLLLRTWHVNKVLKSIAKEFRGKAHVLDAGSGLGQYTWRMGRKNPGWEINGIDIDLDHIEDCKRFFSQTRLSGRVGFETGDLTLTDENEKYDIILSVDVMEHIKDDILVFSNFNKALKKNGYLVISTPSDKGGSDVNEEHGKSFIDEHVRDGYSIEEITSKLISVGFNDVLARYTYGKPGNISWRLSMKYPVMMLNKSYFFFIILPVYYFLTFPVSLILNTFDLHTTHKSGTGLLVTARKR
ncbi:MAG TPA: class I SAM-dependent methyltransferase [Bacteroidales bacterium]|nr:class I SAM-dependent methyltransferase [Bacteroidales bacterium]